MTTPSEESIAVGGASVTALTYRALETPAATLVLGHGAGADQRSSFMTFCGRSLSSLGIETVTFNFLYTEQKRRVPDRQPVLEACYRAVVDAVHGRIDGRRPLFIGGKSMGGRMATHIAAADPELPIRGLVLLGYPLHPPGRPGERRDAHLPSVGRRTLFVQGGRDTFGTPQELTPVVSSMSPPGELHVVAGGDHSFKVTRAAREAAGAAPVPQGEVNDGIMRTIASWIERVIFEGGQESPRRAG